MGTGGGNLSGYFTVALVVLSLGAALCVRDLVLWARVYTRVNSVLKGAVWITLGGTVLAGVQMAVAVQGLRHGGLRGDRGGVWGGAAAYVTVAVGFGMGVSYAALVRATAWTLARNHLDP
jgi:hypothetical protein